ncbi:SUR7/PalI family-domain-containing protein [Apodospora peruviana]|uniref:SUR7/PalI family-domain-containing protein n=1 Tax=Apodospora peruviana TaxID=516989 RepID=A0AAE0MFF6_9PEZI|nr:SUR7/PalI family-domain-containing protein [Apodospora peruviana]
MGNIGRYACVALPFLLTLASLVALLVAGLAGVSDKSLFMFQVNTTDLSISPLSVGSILDAVTSKRDALPQDLHDPSLLTEAAAAATGSDAAQGGNITAADLGLFDLYDISLWGYCYTPQNGSRACTKPTFNWAEKALNETTNNVNNLITLTGQNVTLPKTLTDAIGTFSTVTRWTEIVFIIAYVALGVELFFGIFANCSRAFSCVTFIVAGVATVAVCVAAALATAMSVVVVGAVEGSAKFYGVQADFNTKFLAAVWIAAAFAIAAGFFWLFTVCCCKPDYSRSKSNRRSRDSEAEKLMHGPYQPIGQPMAGGYPQSYGHAVPQQQNYGAPRRDLAYEPYSHANV